MKHAQSLNILKNVINYFQSLPDHQLKVKDISSEHFTLPCMFSVSVNHRGNQMQGFGQSESKDKAIFIAFMEIIERILIPKPKDLTYSQKYLFFSIRKNYEDLLKSFPRSRNWVEGSSNGFAIHSSRKMAQKSALDELIERHVVLKALVSQFSPAKVLAPKILTHGSYVIPSEMTYEFYAWLGPLGRHVVLFKCQMNSKVIYGFGCEKSLERAKEKAFFEASSRIIALHRSQNPSFVVLNTSKNFLYHWYEETAWTGGFLKKASHDMPSIDHHLSYSDFWFGEPPKNELLHQLGLHVVKAVSPKIQPLFAGHWKAKYMNPEALGNDYSFPEDMHMIG